MRNTVGSISRTVRTTAITKRWRHESNSHNPVLDFNLALLGSLTHNLTHRKTYCDHTEINTEYSDHNFIDPKKGSKFAPSLTHIYNSVNEITTMKIIWWLYTLQIYDSTSADNTDHNVFKLHLSLIKTLSVLILWALGPVCHKCFSTASHWFK